MDAFFGSTPEDKVKDDAEDAGPSAAKKGRTATAGKAAPEPEWNAAATENVNDLVCALEKQLQDDGQVETLLWRSTTAFGITSSSHRSTASLPSTWLQYPSRRELHRSALQSLITDSSSSSAT